MPAAKRQRSPKQVKNAVSLYKEAHVKKKIKERKRNKDKLALPFKYKKNSCLMRLLNYYICY